LFLRHINCEHRVVPQAPEKIILAPVRASDFEGELDGLSDALREALPDVVVEVQNPLKRPPGALPTEITEVLTVILMFAGNYAFDTVVDIVIRRLRSTARKGEEDAPSRKVVEIYGPSGEILRRIQIPAEAESEEHPEDPQLPAR
jgi:hypothetical protein